MSKRKIKIYLTTVAFSIILIACTNATSGPSEADILTAMAETSASLPTATISPTFEPSDTPVPTSTPTPDFVTQAFVAWPALNLRTGPSQLYDRLDTYQQGDEVFAIGRVQDGKWLMVEAKRRDGSGRIITGWMFTEYLDLRNNINLLPIIDLPENQTIKGTVNDDAGNPLNGIRVSVYYEPDGSAKVVTYDTTGSDGEFIIYIPENVVGTLDVQITFVNCDSIIVNDDCFVRDYFPLIWRVFVQAPFINPINLVYEKAMVLLEGKVVYKDGWGVPNVWVTATRKRDDAEQKVFTEIGGRFYFPLGEGVWEVIAAKVDPDGITRYSNPEIYTITNSSEQPELLLIPVP
jgi:hypothetical protein